MAADPVLFLDIDGVLNGHEYSSEAESSKIRPDCVEHLNRALGATDAAIVVSSAWRYMVLGGAMTVQGFGYLLRTHGLHVPNGRVLGTTGPDDQLERDNRAKLVRAWLDDHPDVTRWAVVDDLDLGFRAAGMPFVQTAGNVGLTEADADALIALLRGARG